MASSVLRDLRTWVGGYDLSTDMNNAALELMRAEEDGTVFTNTARPVVAGVEDWQATHRGLWSAGVTPSVDSESFAGLGVADVPTTMAHNGAEGEAAYLLRGGRFRYSLLGQHGRLAPFEVSMRGTAGEAAAVRALITKARGDVSGTGATGTALNLGNVAADKYLYAVLHVFSVGTTLTAVVQSDDSAGFASPTTRFTFGPLTTVGGYWGARVAGPLTETHYRLNVTAITGTFSIAALIGIR